MIKIAILAAAAAVALPALTPEVQKAIAPVHDVIARIRAEQAKLPPPKDDIERLRRMGELDQEPRQAWSEIDLSRFPPEQRNAATAAMWREIGAVDAENQRALLAMLPPEGWFTIRRYGADGSETAFHIIQHSNMDLWRRFLPVIEPLAKAGQVKGGDYALMYDRLAEHEGRKQRYGSQLSCQNGKWAPDPVEDPAHVDELRASLGMTSMAENLKRFADMPPCG